MTPRSSLCRPLFLVSPSSTPCGVETYARRLCASWREARGQNSARDLAVCSVKDIGLVWSALADADALVLNFPVVAWKSALAMPLGAFLVALARGKTTVAIVHEWNDLNWRRRVVVGLYLLFAGRLVFSSPSVRSQFARSPIGRFRSGAVAVIPPNMKRPDQPTTSDWSERVREEKRVGKFVLGHFGSIYPKKRSDFVLEIGAELKRRGAAVFIVFVGGFIKGSDRVEETFREKAIALGVADDLMMTGYVRTDAEIFAILDAVDVFAYSFAEGLTSKRGSVLACAQTGRAIVVNAPESEHEFDHHHAFRDAIEQGVIHFVPLQANCFDYADAVETAARNPATPSPATRSPATPLAIYDASWREAAGRLIQVLDDGRGVRAAANAVAPSWND